MPENLLTKTKDYDSTHSIAYCNPTATNNTSELEIALIELEKEIENTADKYQQLESKLQPVLKPQSPKEGVEENRGALSSQLTENIQKKTDKLNSINELFTDLKDRLVV